MGSGHYNRVGEEEADEDDQRQRVVQENFEKILKHPLEVPNTIGW